ncbi:MAG TPA: M50 family metallopeptidase, partial [Polyangiales bacterium]|nr:M50 family metallopeptidase [Polyangiales bacterium]
ASGIALTGTSGRLQEAAVLAGGLVGPSIAAVLLFVMGKSPERARTCLLLIAALLVAALLLVVRNLFGWFFIGGLAVFCGLVAWRGPALMSQLVIVFGGTQLALSVYSRGDYLFTPLAATSAGDMPSDVAQLSAALLLPYWFWGALCGAISVAVLLFGLKYYWRS